MKQLLTQVVQFNSSGTHYINPNVAWQGAGNEISFHGYLTTEVQAQCFSVDSGTVRNLRVDLDSGSLGAGETIVLTVRKNGSNTSVTATMSEGETTANSSSNDFTVAAGDKLSISCVSDITGYGSISLEYETDSDYVSMVSGGFRDFSSTTYHPFAVWGTNNNTIYNADVIQMPAPTDFTITAAYVQVSVAPGAGATRQVNIYKNSSLIDTFGVSDTDTESSETGLSLSVSAGDLLHTTIQEVSGPAAADLVYTLKIESNINGESLMFWASGQDIANIVTVPGNHIGGDTGYYNPPKAYVGPEGMRLRKLYAHGESMGAPASRVFTARKNGSDQALTCTVAATEQSASDSANEVTYSEGDYFDVDIDTTNDTERGQYGVVQYIPEGGVGRILTLGVG